MLVMGLEPVSARRRGDLEEAQHAVGEGLEVEHVVDAGLPLDGRRCHYMQME